MASNLRSRILLIGLIALILYFTGRRIPHFIAEPLPDAIVSIFITDETKYTDKFTHWRYFSIDLGATKEFVQDTLGEPFEVTYRVFDRAGKPTAITQKEFQKSVPGTYQVREENWAFSMSPIDSHYHQRVIGFKDGKVISKFAQLYYD